MSINFREELSVDNVPIYEGNGFSNKMPTGIVTLDIALAGGIPLNGSIIELYGEESSGKTTLAYRICKRCTDSPEGYVTWVDSELSYDDSWAFIQGVNTDKVLPYRPANMESANELIINDIRKYKERFLPWLLDSGRSKWKPSQKQAEEAGTGVSDIEGIKAYMKEVAPPHFIVWDSLAAAPVKSVADDGSDFSGGMAYRARLIKSFLSRYQVNVADCDKIGLIVINQVIENIGDMWNPLSVPGGRGLKHMKHLSIYVKKAGSGEKDQDQFVITDYVKLAITKNKITPIIASFPVIFSKSKGYIGATSLLEYLMEIRWFRDSGSWKKFDYTRVDSETGEVISEEISIQRGNFYKLIEDRPEIFEYLCSKVKDMFVEKFPANKSLISTDVSSVVKSCLNEKTAIPTEEENQSIFDPNKNKEED